MVESICGRGGLVKGGCPPPRRFGWCERASAVGVPGSLRGELSGWNCVGFFLGFAMLLLHVVGDVTEAMELVAVVVGRDWLLGVDVCAFVCLRG